MLNISNSVEQSFKTPARDAFYSELTAELMRFMSQIYPDMNESEVRRRITSAYNICDTNFFKSESQISRLSFIIVSFPEDFQEQSDYAWFNHLLTAHAPAEDRLERIVSIIERAGSVR